MKVKELRKEFDAIKNKYVLQLQLAFGREVKEFFKKFPEARTVSWNQYTPYFNDGDECVFSVNEYSVTVNGCLRDNDYQDDDSDAANAFRTLLSDAGDDVLRAAYGDHVEITLTRDGDHKIKDYEHD